MEDNKLEVPKENINDYLHKLVSMGLSITPAVGGVLSEIFGILITPSLEKRKNKWMQEVVIALDELRTKKQNFSFEELSNNEEFISLSLQLSQVAIRNHQEDKINALRNALVNSYSIDISYDMKMTLINVLEEISSLHIHILQFYRNNESLLIEVDKFQQIYDIFGQLNKYINISLSDFIYCSRDLENRKLLAISIELEDSEPVRVLHSPWVAVETLNQDLPFVRVTKFGVSLLNFIQNNA